jgi:hypothetical protein
MTKKAFYVTTAVAFLFSVLINCNLFIGLYVKKLVWPLSHQNVTVGNTTTLVTEYYDIFYKSQNNFYYTKANRYWDIIKFLFRDLGVALALLAINWLILAQMRQSTRRRLWMANAHKNKNAALTNTAIATLTVVEGAAAEPAMSAPASPFVIAAQKAERKGGTTKYRS